ncbi:acetate/propionate family kinase [Roseimarinus sediminis]|uniref:acetate/propionate family kinase n=1 Tax=Roseimarinus sediminis TaxID=1610899 RepID=UPI003D20A60B
MKVLILNCGSSSIKYQLFHVDNDNKVLAKGQVDRIGNKGSNIEQKVEGKDPIVIEREIADHIDGIDLILKLLTDRRHQSIASLQEIDAVGHRLVHGGEYFSDTVIINEEVKEKMAELIDLAPLHNPANLQGIEAMERLLPGKPQVGVFDTAFHQTMPEKAYLYGIPYSFYKKYHIRRYGFHGTSHKYVAEKACELLGWNITKKKIITCHLGNGASITAIDGGRSIETSMGFTPNYGLVMGTRSGVVDPGIIEYLMKKENLPLNEIVQLLNKKSGMYGMSDGLSSDMRDLANEMLKGNKDAERALSSYAHRVKHYIGAYAAELNGLDLVVMTGGIGENNWLVRELCLNKMEFLGITLNNELNRNLRGQDIKICTDCSKVQVMIIQTNEELVIARETARMVANGQKVGN